MTYLSMADLTQENARLRARVSVLESERRLNAGRKYDETDMIMAVSFAKTLGMSYRERNDAMIRARHERDRGPSRAPLVLCGLRHAAKARRSVRSRRPVSSCSSSASWPGA